MLPEAFFFSWISSYSDHSCAGDCGVDLGTIQPWVCSFPQTFDSSGFRHRPSSTPAASPVSNLQSVPINHPSPSIKKSSQKWHHPTHRHLYRYRPHGQIIQQHPLS
ncbi:hypothetical protein B0H67DRAFT_579298 [Lasiosphaeris hirsuta]|uniref:Uncharacterized protein n=1 Tax=Lasiosphaeris hirsuta TaxID=260670 RepID=A0AA40AFI3_9PEZI|nr:hypothetical protein B0H67DRAFT_579298 [Lasiosphaeris hirsuta]